jgi:ketosteroid isomerase-like protein
MTAREIVNQYYGAWQQHAGDMTGVPLADDFTFVGPVASFDTAQAYAAMARQAGAAVRHQFGDGDLVCSIVDWEMDPLPGVLTAAGILRVRDGQIVHGELIYDAEELRKAMSTGQWPVNPAVRRTRSGAAATARPGRTRRSSRR